MSFQGNEIFGRGVPRGSTEGWALGRVLLICAAMVVAVGCGDKPSSGVDAAAVDAQLQVDASTVDAEVWADAEPIVDAEPTPDAAPNECGNTNPSCTVVQVGPTADTPSDFPLPTDPTPPDNMESDTLSEDASGYLTVDPDAAGTEVLWVADDLNYSVGFVSKIRTTPFLSPPYYREIARYVSVTCNSNATGSTEGVVLGQTPPGGLCADGAVGCCSRDEVTPGANGGHQPIQLIANRPSRIGVDWNGDAWVANRAHWWAGYNQASVTKIANHLAGCIDRNGNGVIDTSSDINNDGIITTDCDDNNLPDSGATVCSIGKDHEFYGLDDECVLFTTNLENGGIGRPLALGPGDGTGPAVPSDAWIGMYNTGVFYRVDGITGAIKASVQVQDQAGINGLESSFPYSASVDASGILWASNLASNALFYFDTEDPAQQGMVQYPGSSTATFYGVAVDGYKELDLNSGEMVLRQQVWLGQWGGVAGAGAFRYRPVRDQGFAGLGSGTWAHLSIDSRGRGLAADFREPNAFVWVAAYDLSALWRIQVDTPDGDHSITTGPPNTYDTTQTGIIGVGVAMDGDVWAVANVSNSVVHFGVDSYGNITSGPDVVPLDDKPSAPETFCGQSNCKPHPYTYSDITGYALRNLVDPKGIYRWVVSGNCSADQTRFLRLEWDADVPANTAVEVYVRSAADLDALAVAPWSAVYDTSPVDLLSGVVPLAPNPTGHLQVAFKLIPNLDVSPTLRSFKILYECED